MARQVRPWLMPLVHGIAALIFGILGVLTLLNIGKVF